MKTKVCKSIESISAMTRPLGRLVVVALSVTILTVSLVPALAQGKEKKVGIDQVPAEVKTAILKEVGDGKLVDIGEITEGQKKLYEIEMVVDGKEFDVLFSSDGKVLKKTFAGLKAEENRAKEETGNYKQESLKGPKWSFDDQKVGAVPAGWKVIRVGAKAKPAKWAVIGEAGAPSRPNVLALTKTDNTGDTWNLLTVEGTKLTDLILEAKVKVISGRHDQGSGLVWRAVDPNNCYLARWTPLSRNFRVYCIKNGKAKRLASVNVKANPKAWHTIRVNHRGERITASLDGRKLIEVKDTTLTGAGVFGVCTKADAAAEFDDVQVGAIRP
ncbi:MAG: hypothetical protein OEW48_20225 [Phycisphaerae bacterium]|nr:hypothetical protein [Phycisphaerae bacterium]